MRNSTNYVVFFIVILTSVVAIMLAGFRQATYAKAEQNEAIFNKRAVLSAIENKLGVAINDLSDEEVLNIFDKQVQQEVINMQGEIVQAMKAEDVDMAKERKKPEDQRVLPLFVLDQDGKKYYIVSVRGNGLWDEIWGYIALENDINTIAGAAFDHQGETPGLGAEIKDNPGFSRQFVGKKLYEDGKYVSVEVRKGGAIPGNPHQVDGISGATITANGVTEMLYRGIKYYEPYFNSLRNSTEVQGLLDKQ